MGSAAAPPRIGRGAVKGQPWRRAVLGGHFQSALSGFNDVGAGPDRLDHTLAAFFPWCIEWEQELRLLFKSYTEAKQERHVLDYDDLLLYWFHLLGDETLVTLLNERFDHILVDELSGHQPPAVLHSPSHAVAQSQPHRRG